MRTGVRVMNLDDETQVVAVARVLQGDDDEGDAVDGSDEAGEAGDTAKRPKQPKRPARTTERNLERGQSTVLMVGVVAVVVAIGAALVGLGAEGVAQGRAQAVADLVALAATARRGRRPLDRESQRRTWVSSTAIDNGVRVTIRLNGREAVAAAER